jgi:isopentenyl diphosphate isomerase/L-lactate dehydrogenase-like FMN-dependent dehydrogenase
MDMTGLRATAQSLWEGRPIESVANAHVRARRRLPRTVYWRVAGATEAERTVRDNVRAFEEIGFRPRAAAAPREYETATTVVGQQLSMPVIISPVGGLHSVHPSGEATVARAAAGAGTAMGLSMYASDSIEAAVAENENSWFQLYFTGDRDHVAAAIRRAAAARSKALIVTIDHIQGSVAPDRPMGPLLPDDSSLRSLSRFAPYVMTKPRWLVEFLRGGIRMEVPNVLQADGSATDFFEAFRLLLTVTPPTWDDLAWVREQWDGPLILKGIMHPDDARRAIDIGAQAVSVSNHGGNAMDSSPGTLRVLPDIVAAADGRIEVLLDGGVRRGSDVVKALALGARAVLIGRAFVFPYAVRGGQGVAEVLEVFRRGITKTLGGIGCSSVHGLDPSCLVQPSTGFPGFEASTDR